MSQSFSDVIRVNELSLVVVLRQAANWPVEAGKTVSQPVSVSLSIPYDLQLAAVGDDITHTVNYFSVCTSLTKMASTKVFSDLEDLIDHIFGDVFQINPSVHQLTVIVEKKKPPLHTRSVSITSSRTRSGSRQTADTYSIGGLVCHAIVGIDPCEREEKQNVSFDITLTHKAVNAEGDGFDFIPFVKAINKVVSASTFQTLEALADMVASESLRQTIGVVDQVRISASKPDALIFASSPTIEITRFSAVLNPAPSSLVYEHPKLCQLLQRNLSPQVTPGLHEVAIAVGSNLGDRFAHVEQALRLLERPSTLFQGQEEWNGKTATILNTSFMYESSPMYVTNQPDFANCACLISTNIPPLNLLELLKAIEKVVGRAPSVRNGPRAIDLDIVFYGSQIIDTRNEHDRQNLENLEGELLVPHPRVLEREFVLRPLVDMVPDFVHPVLNRSLQSLLAAVVASPKLGNPVAEMRMVTPFLRGPSAGALNEMPQTSQYWSYPLSSTSSSRKTYIMATLNATPDSFSDGSINSALPDAVAYTSLSIDAGANIIDIGGYSTRPKASFVSTEEEIVRVVPIIEAIRRHSNPALRNILISVDTFRVDVAKAAIQSGANCINDVYAFTGTDSYPLTTTAVEHLIEMRRLARETSVPIILMHSRGEASANKDYSMYKGGVVEGVQNELGDKVDAIVRGEGGVRRWQVIVDPGLGFSKTLQDNVRLLRSSSLLTSSGLTPNVLTGYPQLIGVSKKSFLGAILEQGNGRKTEAKERGWATAAAVSCAVQQGVNVIRVHDVLEMSDVVKVASYLWG